MGPDGEKRRSFVVSGFAADDLRRKSASEDQDVKECCELKTAGCIAPKRARCPVNGREYGRIGFKTILHHLARPWRSSLKNQSYYFCTDPDCDAVYFGEDETVIPKSALRTKVGVKETSPERLICYCFDVSYTAARNGEAAREFVTDMIKRSLCSCETSNPSGRCCLKDFPRQ